MQGVSKVLEDFIRRFIHSVYEVEILMILREDPKKEWDATEVSQVLHIQRDAIGARLKDLVTAGLLTGNVVNGETHYHYHPATAELARTAEELAHAYTNYRLNVINLIASQPLENIRTFADAFRIRKEGEE
jgi:hypothetical protein